MKILSLMHSLFSHCSMFADFGSIQLCKYYLNPFVKLQIQNASKLFTGLRTSVEASWDDPRQQFEAEIRRWFREEHEVLQLQETSRNAKVQQHGNSCNNNHANIVTNCKRQAKWWLFGPYWAIWKLQVANLVVIVVARACSSRTADMSIYPSIYPSIHPSIDLSIYLSIYDVPCLMAASGVWRGLTGKDFEEGHLAFNCASKSILPGRRKGFCQCRWCRLFFGCLRG